MIYAGAVLLSLPEAAVLTVAAGLLFGTLSGGILAVLGSSAGAIGLFVAVRYHLADAIAARRGRLLDAAREALQRDGFSYLLALRLVPAFPFWLVNLAAALSGMRLLPYAAATVLGIMPATFVYASIGAGLGDVLATGGRPDLAVIFSPRILGPLIGLALLSLLPVAWRRWRQSDA
ncbi:MAG TPA: VTT domain-containing protein [Acetobacteraceae bacterium]|nr:VTT domain-containing protein [Acetobacteraceae bacterium]